MLLDLASKSTHVSYTCTYSSVLCGYCLCLYPLNNVMQFCDFNNKPEDVFKVISDLQSVGEKCDSFGKNSCLLVILCVYKRTSSYHINFDCLVHFYRDGFTLFHNISNAHLYYTCTYTFRSISHLLTQMYNTYVCVQKPMVYMYIYM